METVANQQPTQHDPQPPAHQFGFGLTANTLLFYTLIKGIQLTLFNLIFPLYVYSLGYNQEVIGQLNALGALMVLIVGVPMGMLADRVGRARLLAISGLLAPLTLLGLALARTIPALIFWLLIQNAVSVIYWSATSPLLIGAVPAHRRVRLFSINSFFLWGLGALGSVIGGAIATTAGNVLGVGADSADALRVAMLANAGLVLLGGLPLWRIRNLEAASDGRQKKVALRAADFQLFARLLIPDLLQACGAGAIIGFLPLFFKLQFGIEPRPIGVIFTLVGVLGGCSALSAPLLVRHFGQIRAISGMMVSIAVSIGLLVASPWLAGAIAAEALRAGLRGTIDPIYTPSAISRVVPERRGTLAGMYNVTYATGFSLGPLLSGWLQVHYGFGPAFLVSTACYILAAIALVVLWRGLPEDTAHTAAAAPAAAAS